MEKTVEKDFFLSFSVVNTTYKSNDFVNSEETSGFSVLFHRLSKLFSFIYILNYSCYLKSGNTSKTRHFRRNDLFSFCTWSRPILMVYFCWNVWLQLVCYFYLLKSVCRNAHEYVRCIWLGRNLCCVVFSLFRFMSYWFGTYWTKSKQKWEKN